MSGEGDFLLALFGGGLAVGAAVLGYMVVVYRRLKREEERALRAEKEAAADAARETKPLFFRRYYPE